MQGIKGELTEFLAKTGFLKKYYDQIAMNHWHHIVGEEINKHCRPSKIQGKQMIVICSHPMWTQELSMRKRKLIKDLNKKTGKKIINDIKFVTGQLPENNTTSSKRRKENKKYCLNKDDKKWVCKVINDVTDHELQEKLQKIIQEDIQLKKDKKDQGYQECKKCGIMTKELKLNAICLQCEKEKHQDKLNSIIRVLKESPWFQYEEVNEVLHIEITRTEFNAGKNTVYNQIKDQLKQAKKACKYCYNDQNYAWLKDLLNQYVLLVTESSPKEIGDSTWRKIVGSLGKDYLRIIDNNRK
ncbi:DUF721 domain-containing protein [Natranaerobius trueperi]|nr:DUF721 domain-containing protein [Natranaerobius trueperi]